MVKSNLHLIFLLKTNFAGDTLVEEWGTLLYYISIICNSDSILGFSAMFYIAFLIVWTCPLLGEYWGAMHLCTTPWYLKKLLKTFEIKVRPLSETKTLGTAKRAKIYGQIAIVGSLNILITIFTSGHFENASTKKIYLFFSRIVPDFLTLHTIFY